MNSEEAYRTILKELTSKGKHVISNEYDHNTFGNFLVAFVSDDREQSLVCDRGEIALCNDLKGNLGCFTLIPSIYEATTEELVNALSSI